MTEAPRWRLINEHYLNIQQLPDGTRVEWEHKETARETGRTVRKLFPVPMYLNPKDPSDFNHPSEIIVAYKGDHNNPRDYIFSSDPTPEMEPLNDAAQEITDRLRPKWEHPIETLPVNGGMDSKELAFMKAMMENFAKVAPPAPVTTEVEVLEARLAVLEAAVPAAEPEPTPSTRRV
jgi:hypothetical protein